MGLYTAYTPFFCVMGEGEYEPHRQFTYAGTEGV